MRRQRSFSFNSVESDSVFLSLVVGLPELAIAILFRAYSTYETDMTAFRQLCYTLRETCSPLRVLIETQIRSTIVKIPVRAEARITMSELRHLHALQSFDMSSNWKIRTESSLPALTQLKSLRVSGIQTLRTEHISHMIGLRSLWLDDNYTITDVSMFTNLSELSLRDTRVRPYKALSRLTSLTLLDLSNCEAVTNSILCHFTGLQYLSLCSNRIIVDDTLTGLTQLRGLQLQSNGLITDNSVRMLTNLRNLNLSRNPSVTGQALLALTKLEELHLCGFCLPLDNHLWPVCDSLTCLYMDHNVSITDASLSRMTNLRVLSLGGHTNITDAGLSGLTNLHTLTLSENRGASDESLTHLVQLTDLDLSFNERITNASVRRLTRLKRLTLFRNSNITLDAFFALPCVSPDSVNGFVWKHRLHRDLNDLVLCNGVKSDWFFHTEMPDSEASEASPSHGWADFWQGLDDDDKQIDWASVYSNEYDNDDDESEYYS